VLYIVHFTAFCLGGPFFSGHGVVTFDLKVHLKVDNRIYFHVCQYSFK